MQPHLEGLGQRELLDRFARGLNALWSRAELSLGATHLKAVSRRVLEQASLGHPPLSGVEIEDRGPAFEIERPPLCDSTSEELRAASAELLEALVAVFGELSGHALCAPLRSAVEAALRPDELERT